MEILFVGILFVEILFVKILFVEILFVIDRLRQAAEMARRSGVLLGALLASL